jgi:hypothetical protein
MNAPKKNVRTRRIKRTTAPMKATGSKSAPTNTVAQLSVNSVVYELVEAIGTLEMAYQAIAGTLNADEADMLQGSIEALGEVLTELEKFDVKLAAFRRLIRVSQGGTL